MPDDLTPLDELEARLAAAFPGVDVESATLSHDARALVETLLWWLGIAIALLAVHALTHARSAPRVPRRAAVARVLFATTTGTARRLAELVAKTLREAAASKSVTLAVEVSDAADYEPWERLEREQLLVVVGSTWSGASHTHTHTHSTLRATRARTMIRHEIPPSENQKHVEERFFGHLCL